MENKNIPDIFGSMVWRCGNAGALAEGHIQSTEKTIANGTHLELM